MISEGIDIDLAELEQQARKFDVELAEIMHSDRYGAIKSPPAVTGTLRARPLAELEAFLSGLGIRFRLSGVLREQELRLIRIRKQRDFLLRAIRDRKTARRLLALWHMVHVPLGLTMFLVAFVHIGATDMVGKLYQSKDGGIKKQSSFNGTSRSPCRGTSTPASFVHHHSGISPER